MAIVLCKKKARNGDKESANQRRNATKGYEALQKLISMAMKLFCIIHILIHSMQTGAEASLPGAAVHLRLPLLLPERAPVS
jgi:hypothetical protein